MFAERREKGRPEFLKSMEQKNDAAANNFEESKQSLREYLIRHYNKN